MRRGIMQGLSRWRSNVAGITPTLRPWKSYFYEDDRDDYYKMMMRLTGPRYVLDHARARGVGSCAGANAKEMGQNGTPPALPPPVTPPGLPPSSSNGRFLTWIKLVFGSLISVLLASWMPKWTSILKIEGKAKTVMHEIEQAAEVVEKVATEVEKLSEEVVDNLPNDSKIKEAVSIVEQFSKEAVKDALIAEEIIHKIEDATQDLEDLEEIIVPIIENIVHTDNDKQKKSSL